MTSNRIRNQSVMTCAAALEGRFFGKAVNIDTASAVPGQEDLGTAYVVQIVN